MTTEALADVTVDDLILQTRKLDADVIEAVTSVTIERFINAANTLTIALNDPDTGSDTGRLILNSPLLRSRTVVTLDKLDFELVQVQKSGDSITPVFEDAVVARLRRHDGFRKAARAKMTRAEFARSLVREEPGIRFYCPELTVVQPLANLPKHQRRRSADSKRTPGFSATARLKGRDGSTVNDIQKDVMDRALQVAWDHKAPDNVLVALMEALLVESNATELDHGDGTSVGPLQLTSGKGTVKQRMNTEFSVNWFLEVGSAKGGALQVYKDTPNLSPGELAQTVQASQFPYRYTAQQTYAEQNVRAWKGSLTISGGTDTSHPVVQPYEFTRGQPGQPEDTWTCLLRLAEEVGWHCWCLGDTVFFMSNDTLMESRPRMSIDEQTLGVDNIDFDWDAGKKSNEVIITCHASRWQCPPGSIVELTERMGPVAGRWIVSQISRSLHDDNAEIHAIRYEAAKPEPLSVNWKSGSEFTALSTGSTAGKRAVQWASKFAGRKDGYLYGAKHNLTLQQAIEQDLQPPFDCSSYTRIAWAKAAQIDIGGDTYDQIAKAKADPSVVTGGTSMGDSGAAPPGGWQAGDLLFPFDHHVALAVGDGKHILSASSHVRGIVKDDLYTTVYFWARWQPEENSIYTGVKPGNGDTPGPKSELGNGDPFKTPWLPKTKLP